MTAPKFSLSKDGLRGTVSWLAIVGAVWAGVGIAWQSIDSRISRQEEATGVLKIDMAVVKDNSTETRQDVRELRNALLGPRNDRFKVTLGAQ